MRLPLGVLLCLAVWAGACGKPGPSTGGTTPAHPTEPEPAPFKSGYLRPPSQKRVIIFVNGVFGDSVSTWKNTGSGAYWPELIANDPQFAGSDIYVHSFESPRLSQAQEILELARRMKNYLDAAEVVKNHDEVVFVCHSMGGLVTRAYLLDARIPPDKLSFLFFFGTPSAGANVAGIALHLTENPQLANMQPLDDDTYVKTLREQWLASSDDPGLDYPRKVSSYCAYELEPTWGFQIVSETSATYLCNRATTAILADHLDIVKPADTASETYVALLAAYKNQFGAAAEPIRLALAQRRSPMLMVERRNFAIADLATERISLKQVKATRQNVAVGCEEEKSGELLVPVDLGAGETAVEVHPEIVNANNLKSSSAVLIRFDGKTAVVGYKVRGDCPAGGRADVAVNFVVTRRRQLPPGAIEVMPGVVGRVHPGVARTVRTPAPR
ncbi:MAG: hypothetical protein WEF99_07610 [Thermoanaerobaculia bacterium]